MVVFALVYQQQWIATKATAATAATTTAIGVAVAAIVVAPSNIGHTKSSSHFTISWSKVSVESSK